MAEGSSVDSITRYTYEVTKDGKTTTDYLGFKVNGNQVGKGSGTVAASAVKGEPDKVELKLSDGRTVSAKANYKK